MQQSKAESKVEDEGYAPDRWAFDDEVTRVFDDMLERSIPQYRVMRRAVFDLACRYWQKNSYVVDLGTSRGEALAPLVDQFGARSRFLGIEVSAPMLEAARERFRGMIDCGVVEVREMDLRTGYPRVPASVTLSVLTMCFVPINYRQRVLADCCASTLPGGCLIMVEKVLGSSAGLDDAMVEVYHSLKSEHGYGQDEIERKRLSLEGVLVPVTARWNEELLRSAGFREVDCFWRWFNFAGWIAVK